MEQGFSLDTNVNLNVTLAPHLLQSITVLQYNALELETAISNELASNPLLDECDPDDTEPLPEEDNDRDHDGDPEDRSFDVDDSDDFYGSTVTEDWTNSLGSVNHTEDMTPSAKRLYDILIDKLTLWEPSGEILATMDKLGITLDRMRTIITYAIASLDDDGLLTRDESMPRPSNHDMDLESIEQYIDGAALDSITPAARIAIMALKSLGPSGIAARSVQESLYDQAYDAAMSDMVLEILSKHYGLLSALQYGKLAKELGVTIDEVKSAASEIGKLSLHPARSSDDTIEDIYPIVQFVQHGRHIVPHAIRSHRSIRINAEYAALAKDRSLSAEDRKYIRANLASANNFISAVHDRYATIEKVCSAIIARQKDYFINHGDLVPMTLADIAKDTGLATSTISRTTSGKYADTHYGMLEIGTLFTKEMKQGNTSISSSTIVARIKQLIDNEDKHAPLSDQAITDILVKEGFKISRRGVAKYREESLHILSTKHRKA